MFSYGILLGNISIVTESFNSSGKCIMRTITGYTAKNIGSARIAVMHLLRMLRYS